MRSTDRTSTLTKFNVGRVSGAERSLVGWHPRKTWQGGRAEWVCFGVSRPAAYSKTDARTDANTDTHTGSSRRGYLKGAGESVPRRGEGSGTGVAKRKAGLAKRKAQWVHSTLCGCRLESHACRLENPVERTEANGAGEAVDGSRLRVVGCTAKNQRVTALFWSATAANR